MGRDCGSISRAFSHPTPLAIYKLRKGQEQLTTYVQRSFIGQADDLYTSDATQPSQRTEKWLFVWVDEE